MAKKPTVIIAVGAGGSDAYAETFRGWADQWKQAATTAAADVSVIGTGDASNCVEQLRHSITDAPQHGPEPIWIVLLGHGSVDAKVPKFNLRGNDVSANDLAEWLRPFDRPVIVICSFSASGSFLKPLTGPGRCVITATRSGSEINYSRFGGYLAETIGDPGGDLDKDGQTSLLEAFVAACRKTADFYKEEGRLATEHALLDDNGDGLGTQGDWFRGVRAVKKPSGAAAVDGARAHQLHLIHSPEERKLAPEIRAERDRLEMELEKLRAEKSAMPEADYFKKLEDILLKLARIYKGAS